MGPGDHRSGREEEVFLSVTSDEGVLNQRREIRLRQSSTPGPSTPVSGPRRIRSVVRVGSSSWVPDLPRERVGKRRPNIDFTRLHKNPTALRPSLLSCSLPVGRVFSSVL